MLFEHSHCKRCEMDRTLRFFGLWRHEHKAMFLLSLDGLSHGEPMMRKINILPAKPQYFPQAHPGGDRHGVQRLTHEEPTETKNQTMQTEEDAPYTWERLAAEAPMVFAIHHKVHDDEPLTPEEEAFLNAHAKGAQSC